MADNSDEESISSTEEGFSFLLGGLSPSVIQSSPWKEEVVESTQNNETDQRSDERDQQPPSKTLEPRKWSNEGIDLEQEQRDNCYKCYDRAFHSSPNGIEAPPVRIVDLVRVISNLCDMMRLFLSHRIHECSHQKAREIFL